MINREIINKIELGLDRSGIPVADSGWSSRAIYAAAINSRNKLIDRDQKRSPNNLYRSLRRTIGCIPLVEIQGEECACAPPSGCMWKRTAFEVPQAMGEYTTVNSIGGNLEQMRNYTFQDWYGMKYVFASRFKGETERAYYTLRNNYIYLLTNEYEEFISVTAPWAYPLQYQTYPACDGVVDRCTSYLDFEFISEPASIQDIITLSIEELSRLKAGAAFDSLNNAQPAQAVEPVAAKV